jgi:hypothetical protein
MVTERVAFHLLILLFTLETLSASSQVSVNCTSSSIQTRGGTKVTLQIKGLVPSKSTPFSRTWTESGALKERKNGLESEGLDPKTLNP